jgi:peptidoglycan/LPS O-acetylase OafA/YrhL
MYSSAPEESLALMDEKTLSDLENEAVSHETSRRYPSISLLRPCPPSPLRSFAWALLRCLAPSFIYSRTKSTQSPKKLSPTAYLDGMRGLAALFVFFCHYAYTSFVITIGYGYDGEDGSYRNILTLPIIRLLYSGPPMVCLFFVISGYALSLKPIKQMRAHAHGDLLGTLSSSVFRRGMRLFLPTFASCFLVFVLLRLGLYEKTRIISADSNIHRNVHEYHPQLLKTFNEQLFHWCSEMFNFICVFDWAQFAGSTGYDVHLWTIPVEFRASLILFLTLLGLARLKPWVRMSALLALMLFVLRKDRWEMLLFYMGMFLAELDLVSPQTAAKPPSRVSCALWITAAFAGLFLMSQPDAHAEVTPGWQYLSTQIPLWWSEKYRYYQTLGSMLFALSVTRLPILQDPFTSPPVQYLGRIAYALYLMHGPIMHAFGYRIQAAFWAMSGTETHTQYVTGWVAGALVNGPLVIWAADVFWRAVDAPSVRLARWVENKMLMEVEVRSKELPR